MLKIRNDNLVGKSIYRREYVCIFEVEFITGTSYAVFNAEQKRWKGDASVGVNARGKKKFLFAKKDIPTAVVSDKIYNVDGSFKGSIYLGTDLPTAGDEIFPCDAPNRTIIG